MNQDLSELLDVEFTDPIRMMLSQMPPTNFYDLPAARAATRPMMAVMKARMPAIPGVINEDRTTPGPEGYPGVPVRIYRLALEHPYPAPLEDCYATLKWLASHTDELGIDRSRIGVGGASAGGGGLLLRGSIQSYRSGRTSPGIHHGWRP